MYGRCRTYLKSTKCLGDCVIFKVAPINPRVWVFRYTREFIKLRVDVHVVFRIAA